MIRNIEDGLFLINFIASNSNNKLEAGSSAGDG